MQTFLPYPDFARSARCLDRARLGKQRVECKQILSAILGLSTGWRNHPATRMWEHHPHSLAFYGLIICKEWINRGYKDTLAPYFALYAKLAAPTPDWFGNPDFHAAHRSNLLRKDPNHYGQFGWSEPHDLPYIWPVT